MNAESARKPESAGQRAGALQSVGMPASAAPVADAGTGSAATTSGALPADTTELEPYTRRPRRRRLLLIAGPLAVALGALYALIRSRIEEVWLVEALKQSVPPKTIDTNMAAFDKGKRYVQSHFLRET